MNFIKYSLMVCVSLLLVNILMLYNLNRDIKHASQSDTARNQEPVEDFNRGEYVRAAATGDVEARVTLARYYGSIGIMEAQLFWLKKAVESGYKGASPEVIKACEESIFDQFADP